jgi:hypothetical protein
VSDNHRMRRTLFALLAVVLCAAASPSTQATAAGEWQMSYMTPNGPQEMTMYLSQEGPRLTGHISSEYGEYAVRGSLDGADIKISWSVFEEGKEVPFAVTGKLDGDSIIGSITIGKLGATRFSAQRTDSA